MSERFNPEQHLSKVGKSDYLQVMWRLVWFRDVHPDGIIRTELVSHTDKSAIFKATIIASINQDGSGGEASGYGSETYDDFRDFLEKAETKAIGRALAALGFGTQFSGLEFGGEHESGRIVDSPVASPNGPGRDLPDRDRSTSTNIVPMTTGGITEPQLKKIGAMARALGIEPEQIKAMHGKESATLLTKAEATELIDKLVVIEGERAQQGSFGSDRAERYTQ